MQKSLLLLTGYLILTGPTLQASNPTAPVGYQIQALPATGTATTTTYLGVPLSAASVFSGRVAAVGPATLSVDAATGWQDSQFTVKPHYVRITSGAQVGRTLSVLANTSTSLTLDITDGSAQSTALDTSDFALATGDTFDLVPHRTLGDLFGGIADQIGLWNLRLGAFETYSVDAQTGRWTKTDASSSDDDTNLPVPPHTAVAIVRGPGRGADRLVVTGFPAAVAPLVKLAGNGATQFVGFPLPVDTVLVNLNLGSNWRRKASYDKADVLSLYKNRTGKWKAYYETKAGHWLRPNGTIKDSAPLLAGSVVGIVKRKAVLGRDSFLPVGLTYTP